MSQCAATPEIAAAGFMMAKATFTLQAIPRSNGLLGLERPSCRRRSRVEVELTRLVRSPSESAHAHQ